MCIRGSFQGDFTAALTLSPSHCHPHILTLSPTHCHSHTVTLTPSSSHWHLHPHPHVNVYPTPCTLPLTLPSSHYRPHTVALNLTLILSHYDPHTFTNTHTAILTLSPSALSLSPSHRHPHSLPSHCRHPHTVLITLPSAMQLFNLQPAAYSHDIRYTQPSSRSKANLHFINVYSMLIC